MTPSQSEASVLGHGAGHASTGGAPARGGPTDPSHDEELRRGILHTVVSRRVAGFLVVAFLAIIYSVPASQAVLEQVKGDESVLPDLFRQWPTQESIKQFEEDLDKASYARETVRPRMQYVFTNFGGFGNTKAVIGKDGWLFYQPGVTAVGGPGFLDQALLQSRTKIARDEGGTPLYPDPRPAILDFRAFLADRGIKLVVFPVPDKAGMQPAQLHGRVDNGKPGRNPDHARLVAELESAGVLVFDPTPARLDPRQPPRYLQQDTHWTPDWMQEVARDLAVFVGERTPLPPPIRQRRLAVTPQTVSRVGDVVDMLGLPAGQSLFRPTTVTIQQLRDQAGALFESHPEADVLLLGDSFCNIYTLGQMGWGEAAGLGPQLARALGRDIDIIAQNDYGASATRQLLWNELSGAEDASKDRLAGKKVVIWEFASREFAVGNWKPMAWPRGPSGATPAVTPGATP